MKLSVSLSRAHKVAERIKLSAADHARNAGALVANASFTSKPGPAQVARLAGQAAEAKALLKKSDTFYAALASLRAAIASENERRGVSALLSQVDAVQRAVAARKAMLESFSRQAIPLSEVENYQPLSTTMHYGQSLVVQVADAETEAELNRELKELQRKALALSDKISTANAAFFEIELPDEVADEVIGE